MHVVQSIQNRIYELRGERIILDFDLAILYDVETRVINQAVKRNITRFPDDFMFQLTEMEWQTFSSSQFVMMKKSKNRTGKYLPYAFTEQGIAMMSSVLHSNKAIQMNITIMRAFVEVRKIFFGQNNLKEQLLEVKQRLGEHDAQLNQIYDAIENLLDESAARRKWSKRQRIGFKEG